MPKRLAGHPPPLGAYDADIIILSLNRERDTIEAIDSALSQRGLSLHVTVLDQGSAPGMLTKIKAHFGRNRHFALYAPEENLGVAGGRNLAAAFGHGQIIIGLDNDAIFENPFVAANTVRAFAKRPNLGALGFRILATDGKTLDLSSWAYPKPLLPRGTKQFDTTTFTGAGHAIRRAAWNAVGGYDPRFFFTWEEYDFCLEAIARGWRIAYDGKLAVIHKVSPEARLGWGGERMRHFVRNRLLIGRKWGQSWASLSPRICGYLLKASLHGHFAAALDGVKAAYNEPAAPRRAMPKTMRHYLRENESRHRGSWLARLRLELLGKLPS